MGNWEREFNKWAPQLYTVSFSGNALARRIISEYELFPETKRVLHAHVVLCSYETVLSERALLFPITWESIIVDEGQRLKNFNSKLFKELSEFKANFRLLLTGTPLQNNLKELFTLMAFLDPEKVIRKFIYLFFIFILLYFTLFYFILFYFIFFYLFYFIFIFLFFFFWLTTFIENK